MHLAQSDSPLRLSSFCHQSLGEVGLCRSNLVQALVQVGAEVAQVFDAGDDAVLFGEGWNRDRQTLHITNTQVLHR